MTNRKIRSKLKHSNIPHTTTLVLKYRESGEIRLEDGYIISRLKGIEL